MLVRAPLVEAEQDGSIRIQDLTEVVMARRRLGLAKERLVPFEAARDVSYADDRPCAFHRISAIALILPTLSKQPGDQFLIGIGLVGRSGVRRARVFLIADVSSNVFQGWG
jgi:hypothetical protein